MISKKEIDFICDVMGIVISERPSSSYADDDRPYVPTKRGVLGFNKLLVFKVVDNHFIVSGSLNIKNYHLRVNLSDPELISKVREFMRSCEEHDE